MPTATATYRSEWIESARRVRVEFGHVTIADSSAMMLLRQHGFLPVYYFPERHVRTDLLQESGHTTYSPYKGAARYFDVRVGSRTAAAAAWTYPSPLPGSPDTRGYYSFHWYAMDAWLEEDEILRVHARDPYLRVDALSSSRRVAIRIKSTVVADTCRPILVIETGLVTRYYVPKAHIRQDLFVPSSSYSMCPYKGEARYLSYASAGEPDTIEDVAWYYPSPLADVAKIAGHVCFWNEREDVEIEVDGRPLERLPLRESGPGGELLYPSRLFFAVPPPATMLGMWQHGRQHDFARPNGRAEGPPEESMDMDIERAGGPRTGWALAVPPVRGAAAAETGAVGPRVGEADIGARVPSTGGDGERAGRSLLFTFGPSRLTRARTGGDSAGGQRGDDVQSAGGVALPESEGPEGRREEVAPPFEGTPIGLPASVVCEPARRRVRALVSGRTVADSAKAVLFASGSSPPAFFFPPGDLNGELIAEGPPSASGDLGAVGTFRLVHEAPSSGTGGGAPATATLTAYAALDPPHGLEPLRGRVYLPWHEVDTWLEEDDELIGHPRLPYHRVDALWSSRTVVARIGGRLLAASDRPVVVFETGTPPRYYVPRIDTVMHRLVPSGRVADSPYLGRATSYSARIGDRLETDVAWAYPFPVRECPKIAGRICFDESRVEIEVDKAT